MICVIDVSFVGTTTDHKVKVDDDYGMLFIQQLLQLLHHLNFPRFNDIQSHMLINIHIGISIYVN